MVAIFFAPQTEMGFEDYQMPTSLADLISAIGATPIDFSP